MESKIGEANSHEAIIISIGIDKSWQFHFYCLVFLFLFKTL
jgi:hypothetical protein